LNTAATSTGTFLRSCPDGPRTYTTIQTGSGAVTWTGSARATTPSLVAGGLGAGADLDNTSLKVAPSTKSRYPFDTSTLTDAFALVTPEGGRNASDDLPFLSVFGRA
jgi:hypothetical protein